MPLLCVPLDIGRHADRHIADQDQLKISGIVPCSRISSEYADLVGAYWSGNREILEFWMADDSVETADGAVRLRKAAT